MVSEIDMPGRVELILNCRVRGWDAMFCLCYVTSALDRVDWTASIGSRGLISVEAVSAFLPVPSSLPDELRGRCISLNFRG